MIGNLKRVNLILQIQSSEGACGIIKILWWRVTVALLFFILFSIVCSPSLIAQNNYGTRDQGFKLTLIASKFSQAEQFDSAALYLTEAKEIFESLEDKKELANTLYNLSLNCFKLGQFDASLEHDFKALSLREEIKDQAGVAKSYVSIATDFYLVGKYQNGLDYGLKALKLCEEEGDQEALGLAYHGLSSNYMGLQKFDEALPAINKAVEIKQKNSPNTYTVLSSINTQGNVLKLMGNYKAALISYEKVIELGKILNAKRGLATGLANTGHTYLLLKNDNKALPYLLEAVKVENEINFLANLPEQYMHISNIYENNGDFENALIYHKKHTSINDSLFTQEKNRASTELQTQYETGKKDALLNVKDEQLNQQKKSQWLVIGIALTLALLLFTLYRSYLSRSKRLSITADLNKKLVSKNKENELLLKEIHHRVKNNLEVVSSLLALQSAQIDDPEIQNAMQASQNRVQSMGILHQKLYQSEHLAFIEMKNYFSNLSENLLDSYNASDRIMIDLDMKDIELDIDSAVPVGLIVNELLTNAVKYAFPTGNMGNIKLSLIELSNKMLQLNVADNGVGKLANEKPKGTGFGTQLIDLLTQQLDGQITQTWKDGTSIFIQFPRR